jgi:YVTN family beta-propeller protein
MTRSFFALVGAIATVLGVAPSSAQNAYITNAGDNTVSVIVTATNTVVGSPITVGANPQGVAVTPDGSKVYVANAGDNTVSVIDTVSNMVVGLPIKVGVGPIGVAVTPDGSKVYVANELDNTVSVIATVNNSVSTIKVGASPIAFGIFIQPKGTKEACKNGGWKHFVTFPGPFRSQGQCVSFFAKQQ